MRIKNRLPLSLSAVFFLSVLRTAAGVTSPPLAVSGAETLPLQGRWGFSLDVDRRGIQEKWYTKNLPEQVMLPGTTDENQKGNKNEERTTEHLSRRYIYQGLAWYQRRVEIPAHWKDKRIVLFLERSKQTALWVDSQSVGTQNSLCVPHVYDVTKEMVPGEHTVTIQVDNDPGLFPIGRSHATLEDTQTDWNGIIGDIQLIATDKVWLDDIQIFPDAAKRKLTLCLAVGNITGQPATGRLTFTVHIRTAGAQQSLKPLSVTFAGSQASNTVTVEYPLKENSPLWDEFSPTLCTLDVRLEAKTEAGAAYTDSRDINFGLRDFRAKGTQFSINGRATFLRGKHDACVFPLTGYAPMDKASWLRVFTIAKSYGINLYRFHSWCPPEAAFQAADEVGMYLQPELPNSTSVKQAELPGETASIQKARNAFQQSEGERILKQYGNHPSFVMFTLGNELGGDRELFAAIVRHFRQLDPRHLYASGSNNWLSEPKQQDGDDFWTTSSTARAGSRVVLDIALVRGSMAHPYLGHLNTQSPSTTVDYTDALAGVTVPVIGHEIGQYEIFPNFREMGKYTGVLQPVSFEIFRERLREKNMLDQADDFVRASGKLATLCYREDIEAALRTPGFGGFHLLDLQDMPGHGTCLDGILDSFMDSKGLITPEAWREFCSETVPLVLMPKYTWTRSEIFNAEVKIAHYGPAPITRARPVWTLRDDAGIEIASGRLPVQNIPAGALSKLGTVSIPLHKVRAPQKLSLEVAIQNTAFVNRYPVWIYPDKVEFKIPDGLRVSRVFDQSVEVALQKGASVLLLPDPHALKHSLEGAFISNFCTYPLFKVLDPPGTLGILCDPKNPAFIAFPTEFHSNWQWWHLVKNARPVILDQMPADFRPLVQVVDNFDRNHKLGLIFEARVGGGKLLFCSIDLLTLRDKPEARQLLYSLVAYMGSKEFTPVSTLSPSEIRTLFREND